MRMHMHMHVHACDISMFEPAQFLVRGRAARAAIRPRTADETAGCRLRLSVLANHVAT